MDTGYERAKREAYQEKLETTRRMKARGRPIEKIAEDTGLSVAEIKDL